MFTDYPCILQGIDGNYDISMFADFPCILQGIDGNYDISMFADYCVFQGIDGNDDIPMNLDTIEKLDRRAKRFNTTNPMPADEVS